MRRGLKIAGLVVIALLGYAVFLAVSVPAGVAWPWVEGRVPVRLYQPSGTLWSGQAAALMRGERRIDNLRWEVEPVSLLRLDPTVHLRGATVSGDVGTTAHIGLGDSVRLTDVKANVDVDTVLAWAGRGGLDPFAEGRFDALLTQLELRSGRPVSARGVINWNQAAIGPGGRIPLGDLALRLEPAADDQGIRGTLSSRGGILSLNGDLRLAPEGDFRIDATISPRNPDDPEARQITTLLGLANPSGSTRVSISGNLNGGGLSISQQ